MENKKIEAFFNLSGFFLLMYLFFNSMFLGILMFKEPFQTIFQYIISGMILFGLFKIIYNIERRKKQDKDETTKN